MQRFEPLEFGKYYHIYNRGINGCNIFLSENNYNYFLKLIEKYLVDIVDLYAFVLMPYHFHFLVRIKEVDEIPKSEVTKALTGSETLSGVHPKPSQAFSNLFNAYSQAFNTQYNRHGSLFERPFKRKLIANDEYLKKVFLYIHKKPIHHNFVSKLKHYKWSSFGYLFGDNSLSLHIQKDIINVLGGFENFISLLNVENDFDLPEQLKLE